MFGQPDTTDNTAGGQVPPMDPGVMADPSSMPSMTTQTPPEHQMTPAYQMDDPQQPAPSPAVDSSMLSHTAAQPQTAPTQEDHDLLDIKQDALNELSPLVGQLEQSPEEKFRTTMMMIQASDDRTLVKQAYEAAKQITDEKSRAQALLDVINEINYFTSHTS